MSSNLPWTALAENQASPEAPINDAHELFDNALTGTYVADVNAGNVNVSSAQSTARRILVKNASVADRIVTLVAAIRILLVQSDAANTHDVEIKVGTATFDLEPGSAVIVVMDGTTNGMQALPFASGDGGGGVEEAPNDGKLEIAGKLRIAMFIAGLTVNNEVLFRYVTVEAFSLPAGSTGKAANARAAATAETVFKILKNSTEIGTITFAASGAVGTIVQSGTVSFAANDILTITGPTTADTTLADIAINLTGNRT